MNADLSSAFKFADGKIVFDRIDLLTDGAVSTMTGRRRARRSGPSSSTR